MSGNSNSNLDGVIKMMLEKLLGLGEGSDTPEGAAKDPDTLARRAEIASRGMDQIRQSSGNGITDAQQVPVGRMDPRMLPKETPLPAPQINQIDPANPTQKLKNILGGIFGGRRGR